jgi:O-antigen/teichoic acid export membrane protein
VKRPSRHQLSTNVLASIGQVIVAGAVLLVVYRYLLVKLGIEQIGIWSIVLATASISRLAEFGLTGGVVRFVAHDLSFGNRKQAAALVETVALTVAAVIAGLLVLGFPVFQRVIFFLLTSEDARTAINILPVALASFWVTTLATVFLGGLDGCQRTDLRSYLLVGSQFLYLAATLLLVPEYGLEGVARAQFIQSFSLAVLSWCLLRRHIRELSVIPLIWDYGLLKRIAIYGLNFQMTNAMALLLDPMTKAIMSKFGGLAPLGYYEMANRLVGALRGVIIEANRVLVPLVSQLSAQYRPSDLRQVYDRSLRISLVVVATGYSIMALCSSTISLVWIGTIEHDFIVFFVLLAFGWSINTLAGPAFFQNIGTGKLGRNVVGQATIAGLNITLGISAGYFWGPAGVVLALSLSLALGSLVIILSEKASWEVGLAIFNSQDGRFVIKQLAVALCAFGISLLSERVWSTAFVGNVVLLGGSLLIGLFALDHWRLHSRRLLG